MPGQMPILIKFPSAEEEERARRFQVHKQYLAAIREFLAETYKAQAQIAPLGVLESQRDLRGFRRIQRQKARNPDLVRRYLAISWASETQLRIARATERELLRYSNVWAPVHAYYAVYMALQAWFASMNLQGLVDDHSATLRTASRHVTERTLLPLPWNVGCRGTPHLGEVSFLGLPDGADPNKDIELLSNPSPDTFWPRYCKMLETTRTRRLDRHFDEWKRQNNRKQIRAAEKRSVESRVWATTIFDFLFRLRVRANYREVASFLMSAVGEDWQSDFLQSLIRVTDLTTLLLDSLVVQQIGPDLYRSALDEFLEHDIADLPKPARFLMRRRVWLVG